MHVWFPEQEASRHLPFKKGCLISENAMASAVLLALLRQPGSLQCPFYPKSTLNELHCRTKFEKVADRFFSLAMEHILAKNLLLAMCL